MRRRSLITIRSTLFFSLLLFGVIGSIHAQVRVPAEALEHERRIQEVIQQGMTLESERRWGEAITLYEKATKDAASSQAIDERLKTARIHFDLERRLADNSFLQLFQSSNRQQALGVYNEVLKKIDTFHVDTPNWTQLAKRGVENIDVALSDPQFLRNCMVSLSPEQVESVRREVWHVASLRPVRNRTEAYQQAALVSSAMEKWSIPAHAIVYEYACGAACSLDWYSSFLTTSQYQDVMSQIEGNFVGLGIELRPRPDYLEVVGVISTGPAGEAGIRAGDRIVEVDRETVVALTGDRAADLLRGVENSYVHLAIQKEDGQISHLNLQRRRVEIPSVEDAKIIDPSLGVAYIKLTNFQRTTKTEFVNALWKLYRDGMQTLIVDLRGNPGGLLDASVELSDLFLTEGTIVSTRGRNPREDIVRRARRPGTWQVPLTLLIDGNSASASEIFAGAIQDHHRGTVVGQRSYGKGSVQGIFPLDVSTEGLRLTTARFFSPSGQAISRHGVNPDVAVQMAAKPVADDGVNGIAADVDAGLSTAVQVAAGKVSHH